MDKRCYVIFSGTELTKANLHTADGISVRFPRVTKIRDDKDWKSATNLEELKHLYKTSKEKTDVSLLNKLADASNDEPPLKKMKTNSSKTKESPTKATKISPINRIDRFLIKKEEKKPKVDLEKLDSSHSSEVETRDVKKEEKKMKIKSEMSDFTNKDSADVDIQDVDMQDAAKKEEKRRKIRLKKSDSSDENSSDVEMPDERNKSVDEIDSKELSFNPVNPLPDVFSGKKLGFYPDFLSFPEDERNHFERHWIAYGGTVVKAIRSLDVDFLLHNNKSIEFENMKKLKRKLPADVRHVHKNWLMKCINDVCLCDTTKYAVRVEP